MQDVILPHDVTGVSTPEFVEYARGLKIIAWWPKG
jgi:hypothetical protein